MEAVDIGVAVTVDGLLGIEVRTPYQGHHPQTVLSLTEKVEKIDPEGAVKNHLHRAVSGKKSGIVAQKEARVLLQTLHQEGEIQEKGSTVQNRLWKVREARVLQNTTATALSTTIRQALKRVSLDLAHHNKPSDDIITAIARVQILIRYT